MKDGERDKLPKKPIEPPTGTVEAMTGLQRELTKRDGGGHIIPKNGKYKPTKEQMQAVLEFAIKHKVVINPLDGIEALVDFNQFGRCVCDPARPTCPCEQAPQEIKEKGHCKCHFFWRDYETYMEDRYGR